MTTLNQILEGPETDEAIAQLKNWLDDPEWFNNPKNNYYEPRNFFLNKYDVACMTPFLYVVDLNKLKFAEVFLAKDPSLASQCGRDDEYSYPLYFSCAFFKVEMTNLLLSYGAPFQVNRFYKRNDKDEVSLVVKTPLTKALESLNTPLLVEQLEMIRILLNDKGIGNIINFRDNEGKTALMHFVIFLCSWKEELIKQEEFLKKLRECNKVAAEVIADVEEDYNASFLSFKEMSEKISELISLFKKAGATIDQSDDLDRTPLSYAAGVGVEIVKALIENGACPNMQDVYDKTPLCYAAAAGDQETVAYLLANGAYEQPARGSIPPTTLMIAAWRGDTAIMQLLLEKMPGVQGQRYQYNFGDSPLHIAAYMGHTEIVAMLLEKGWDPEYQNENDLTPFMSLIFANAPLSYQAVSANCTRYHEIEDKFSVPKLTEEEEIEGIYQQTRPIMHAKTQQAIANLLLAKRTEENEEGAEVSLRKRLKQTSSSANKEKALAYAISTGNKVLAQLLLDAGVNPNAQVACIANATLLCIAVAAGNLEMIQMLLARGAKVDLPPARTDTTHSKDPSFGSHDDLTPLVVAAYTGDLDVMQLLLANIADPNAPYWYRSSVEKVQAAENERMVNFLLNTGVTDLAHIDFIRNKPDNPNRYGTISPLHVAVTRENKQSVALLLQNKANPSAINQFGHTPVFYICGMFRGQENRGIGLLATLGEFVKYTTPMQASAVNSSISLSEVDLASLFVFSAANMERLECLKLLFKAGAQMSRRDINEFFALLNWVPPMTYIPVNTPGFYLFEKIFEQIEMLEFKNSSSAMVQAARAIQAWFRAEHQCDFSTGVTLEKMIREFGYVFTAEGSGSGFIDCTINSEEREKLYAELAKGNAVGVEAYRLNEINKIQQQAAERLRTSPPAPHTPLTSMVATSSNMFPPAPPAVTPYVPPGGGQPYQPSKGESGGSFFQRP